MTLTTTTLSRSFAEERNGTAAGRRNAVKIEEITAYLKANGDAVERQFVNVGQGGEFLEPILG